MNSDTLSSNNHEGNSINNLLSHSIVAVKNFPTIGNVCIQIWSSNVRCWISLQVLFTIYATDHTPVFNAFPVASSNKSEYFIKSLNATAN